MEDFLDRASQEARRLADNFDNRWGPFVKWIVTHPRLSFFSALGAGLAIGFIIARIWK